MGVRVLLFLLVLGTSWCCNARVVTTDFSPVQNGITPGSSSAVSATSETKKEKEKDGNPMAALQQINQERQEKEVEAVEEFGANEQLCKLCVNIATPALKFLKEEKNQQTIYSTLNKICSLTLVLKDKCSTAVDYYLTMLYTAVDVLTPQTFCMQISLCAPIVSNSQNLSKISCESFHDFVTQLGTIDVLLKACDAVEVFEGFAQKCKTLVSVYAPMILGNAEQFLRKYDMCTTLHASSSSTEATVQTSMHSAS